MRRRRPRPPGKRRNAGGREGQEGLRRSEMCLRNMIAVSGLVVLAAAPAAAQGMPVKADLFGQNKPAPPPKVDWNARPSADRAAPEPPKVVCGLTLVPGDTRIDR